MSKHRVRLGSIVGIGAIAFFVSPVSAQVTPDDTLPERQRSRVRPDPSIPERDLIRGGQQRDQNLFHSFEQFDIETGREAYFIPRSTVETIFSRVTGGDRSEIRGTLGVIGNADLFLINPNGFLFGPNSSLDLNGSLTVTTASTLQFGDRGIFSATNPESPSRLLTISPSAFLFNQVPMGDIVIRSTSSFEGAREFNFGLSVDPGETLSLLGGDVRVEGGGLNAFGGQINIGAVDDVGEVVLSIDGFEFSDRLRRGNVRFSERSQVDVSTSDNGGDLIIQARRLQLTEQSVLQAGVRPGGSVERQIGDIQIDATNEIVITQSSSILNTVFRSASGDAGDIRIDTSILNITDGGQLFTNALGTGNAGNVTINASTQATFQGISRDGEFRSVVLSSVREDASGNSGDIEITTPILEVLDGAQLSTNALSEGNAGNITIDASEYVLFQGISEDNRFRSIASSQIRRDARGEGGDIEITTPILDILDGAQLSASTRGRGDAGDITIYASDRVTFQGVSDDNQFSSSAVSEVNTNATGNGGNIEIATPILEILDGAQLSANTLGDGDAGTLTIDASRQVLLQGTSENERLRSGVYSLVEETAEGEGGNIQITTSVLEVLDGAQLSTNALSEGNAGNITIDASEYVLFQGTSENNRFRSIASSQIRRGATGAGGDIEITTPILDVLDGAQLSASTRGRGNAGDVTVYASDRVTFQGGSDDNQFSSSAVSEVNTNATGNGGNVEITTPILEILDGAQLSASTLGNGNAGNIRIFDSNQVTFAGRSEDRQFNSGVFSTAETDSTGDGGNIRIETDNLELSDRALISVQSDGAGQAGDIRIIVGDTFISTNSNITTSSIDTSGGNIRLQAGDIRLFGDSDLSTNSGVDGGNITLPADSIIAFDDSDIFAFAQEQGGDIRLNTPAFFGNGFTAASLNADPDTLDNNDRVDINATGAVSGTVVLPDLSFIQNNLTDLPQNAVDTDTLLKNSCIARTEDGSTFFILGTDGLPVRPGDASTSPYPTDTIREIPSNNVPDDSNRWEPGDPIEEPQGLYQLRDGRLVLSQECVFE